MAVRDLLFELGTEELPPHALLELSQALADGVVKGLDAAAILHAATRAFATPRRLAVYVAGCAEFAAERSVERRGPPVSNSFDAQGSPTPAAIAFAKSCGVEVTSLQRLTTEKGAWLQYRGSQAGAATATLLAGIVQQAVAGLPIAKRMRWGASAAEFVRPVRSLILLFGADVVPVELFGLDSDRITHGHRFHAPRPVSIKEPKTYERQLRAAKVVADFSERRERVRAGVMLAASTGTALIEADLLDEVTALVEWPVPIAGRFEARFLALPREVVIATIQEHQRYFAVEGSDGRLTGDFVTVSNLESRDPVAVQRGNERVVRPRLSDAAFFWEQDLKLSLQEHAATLGRVTFQTKLGSYADKTRRIKALAESIGRQIDAPQAGRAADLCKADLMTAMVGEFPELQGTMGRYYAAAQGESAEVALALEEQYRPRFAGDTLPSTKTGQALALADKLDTLAGIFAIEQRPTGTKDPFGLRRSALGVLRILIECRLDLDLLGLIAESAAAQPVQRAATADEVAAFVNERLKGLMLEDAAASTEMVDAVLATRPSSPLDAIERLRALQQFLRLPDAGVLAALNKRVVNILRKSPPGQGLAVRVEALTEAAEIELHGAVEGLQDSVNAAVAERRYADALSRLLQLRIAVDNFFERIMVMDEDLERRNNRLALLRKVERLLSGVADLSRLPG